MPARFALWDLGFRPFYLGASIFASVSIALWGLQYAGWLPAPYLAGPVWHAHEMLFGFTLAVLTGFLFTAARNWTGQPTPSGGWLAALAALWVAGRVLVLTPWAWAAAIAVAAFPVAAAIGIAIPLVRSRNRRNYFFIALLLAMGASALAVHLVQMGRLSLPPWLGIQVALDVMLLIMTVMGGRVIPMFSNNGAPGTDARRHPMVEKAVLFTTVAVIAGDALNVGGWPLSLLLLLCALSQGVRLLLWHPWRTRAVPLVWVLHAAYLWIPIHLILRTLTQFDLVPSPLSAHALTLGAIGGLTIGMMTRTARGHTGRPLKADRYEVACYVLVLGAAVIRVFGPLLVPSAYGATVLVSALMWSAGYGIYAWRYWPVLTRA
jgi:uncharacterized protein involved in response to NO